MEQRRPMDRLVCGDVGFGKTEIAIRAAMKAAVDNKQVAVLVPTTVLALQHFKTFAKRLKAFPVKVDYLSRARTTKQTNEILRELEAGTINIIIGTHKLVSKAVKFKDLGLLIIDEEQKFGVSVKEKLRQMKVNVDTLTMSATPIPRTLQFSLMGARDFSTIQTPPPNRHPIQTEIHTFNAEVIADAINFEMSRNGQVFFVTHRIAQLEHLRNIVEKHVPDARVAIGHGQMPPAELEKIILDFVNYDYDILISTTIVESGIDIPNANTIIIDNAHHFGLSDLHQMRGRVGRGNRKAFCYLLAPPLSNLPDDSRRRLQAIENFSDLGSGIHIAMQDLDIRGAGNLLGAEQSGFIADLGYETYQKILAQAITELKNEEFTELFTQKGTVTSHEENIAQFVDECNVDCDLHAYFPETYVPGSSERMMLYRELDGLTEEKQLQEFKQRMEDRFGPIPPEGEELLRIQPLRKTAKNLGIERIALRNQKMILYFVSNANSPYYMSSTFERILQFATTNYRRCKLEEKNGKRSMTLSHVPSVEAALTLLRTCMDFGDINE
jgi:transcription-repair coupling factor (superfamily II helicase)